MISGFMTPNLQDQLDEGEEILGDSASVVRQ